MAGDRMIPRKRFWLQFFDHYRLEIDGRIETKEVSDYEYEVFPWVERRRTKPDAGQVLGTPMILCEGYISYSVRREVWKRDNGRRAECGSQEKLAFDRVIRVSNGRNIRANSV
jgi:hypothetical protein